MTLQVDLPDDAWIRYNNLKENLSFYDFISLGNHNEPSFGGPTTYVSIYFFNKSVTWVPAA